MTTTRKQQDQGFSKFNQIKIEEMWLYRMYDGKESDREKWIDISSFHQELNIFEDITCQTLSAQLLLVDPVNLPDRFPVVGGERISIKYRGTADTDSKELVFVIYKIGDRLKPNHSAKNQSYWLYLATPDRYLDVNLDISKAYSGTYTGIVRECLADLQSQRPLDLDESSGNASFISPYWSPLKSVAFCAKRAMDLNNSPFLFWETMSGYNFKSAAILFKQTPTKTIFFEPRQNDHHINDLNKSLNTVIRMEFKESNNKLEQYANNTFGSRIFYFNLDTKKVELAEIDYRNQFKNSDIHIEPYPLTDDMANVRKKNTFSISLNDNSHLGKYLRNIVFDHLSNYRVLVELPGDSTIGAGQIVSFEIPALSDALPGYQKEVLTSGRWLIASIRHQIGRDQYHMFAELVKDSHAVDIQESVYGKTHDDIDSEDKQRKEKAREIMSVAEVLNRNDGITDILKDDEEQQNNNQNWIDRIKDWAFR